MTRGTNNGARRRSNKKSRYGCKQCKQRHVKCDETLPSCVNCKTCNRECSFLTSLVIRKVTVTPSPVSPPACPPQYDTTQLTKSLPTSHFHEAPSTSDQVFKLHHLELLHHFKSDMFREMTLSESQARLFIEATVRQAVQTPYLMDQLLALSALHASTEQRSREQFYRDEATSLQTRALASFNAANVVMTDENCMSVFLFSILLSQHVVFDTLSTRTDFPIFLNKLVVCLNICGGTRTIAGQRWGVIETHLQQHAGISTALGWIPGTELSSSASEFSRLKSLIMSTDLSPPYTNACVEALNLLQSPCYSIPECKDATLCRANRALRWLVCVPNHFVELVEQRRPEALTVLAYYAVLIHEARGYWAFGDAGRFIIREITRFLGSYWADWLAWPNGVLDETEGVEAG